ncbi:hypothetical protein [Pontibacillus sp. HMF3514]|uniref:hypothetical protein n=1 Tax=Pontibacillus sp. HMF3514 TaxID=2692425 RepID=UPI00131F9B5B|nr:hypothetical protein [Pontibacillus sp. HMF3514]QHE51593.1 hypothetical protein GS400_05880 [Pontibacillus sp. HMF3514]
MQKIISISSLILLLIMITACTGNKDDFVHIYSGLLPDEDDKYSLQVAGKEINIAMLHQNDISNVNPIINTESHEELNNLYPKLKLKQTPAFVVFDKNGVVLKTYDYDELIDFLKNNTQ